MYRQIHKFLRDALVKSSCFCLFIYLLMVMGPLEYIQSDIIDTTIRDLGLPVSIAP